MGTIIVQLGLAILLFYALNWIGRHSSGYGYLQLSLTVQSDHAPAFNFILKAFTPTVFIVLVSVACYLLHLDWVIHGIWRVAAYYFGFRIFYNLVLGRALLLNWLSVSIQTVVGVAAAFLAYRYLIVPRRPLLPDLDKIGDQLWIIVALFLYAAFNSIRTSDAGSARRKNKYFRSRFSALRGRYGDLIEGKFPARYMELVAYAILIYETFNRPSVVRVVEHAVFPWHSKTIGPMQVRSQVRLTDRDGVHLGVQKLGECFKSTDQELSGKKNTRFDVIRLALAKYNRDTNYINEVNQVLYVLWAQIAPEYRAEFEQMYMVHLQ